MFTLNEGVIKLFNSRASPQYEFQFTNLATVLTAAALVLPVLHHVVLHLCHC